MAHASKWMDKRADEEQSLMSEDWQSRSDSTTRTVGYRGPELRRCSLPMISTLKDVLLISFAIAGLIGVLRDASSHRRMQSQLQFVDTHMIHQELELNICDCGNSTADAVSLGCKYDSLAAAWLPEHCRDDELTAEFEGSGPGVNGVWTYWADTAHTTEISIEDIAKMADDQEARFHTSGHWHVIHCIFYWRKEHRARFNGKIVEPRSDNEKHIKHCGMIFQDPGYGTIAGVALNTDME